MASFLLPLVGFLVVSMPFFVVCTLFSQISSPTMRWAYLLLAPSLFLIIYALTAALLSRFGTSAIIKGSFPRNLRHPVYGRRRIYGFCWNAIYYCTPLYFLCLAFPTTRGLLFKAFGYKASNDITIFPDTWLRDLPLLRFGAKAYIANRSTIGTNMCLSNGKIMVDEVRVGEGSMVGHMALMGPGATMEAKSELGISAAIGIRAKLQQGAKAGSCVTLFHGADIGPGAEVGACSYIGLRAKIGPNVKVPPCTNITAGTVVNNQEEMAIPGLRN
jgi:carbonic anhydrase/acetyltransferase-like protein (isoleucine patch superfamily)